MSQSIAHVTAARDRLLSVADVHKEYGLVRAVDGVSFDVRPGEIAGVRVGHRAREVRRAPLAVVLRDLERPVHLGERFLGLVLEVVVARDAVARRREPGVQVERLAVHRDRLVVAPALHEQLGVRIVGVRIVGDELDVLLERRLRLIELVQEAFQPDESR